MKALVAAAKTGQFDHVAQRARDQRAEHAAYTEAAATLEEQQIPVVDRPQWDDRKVRPIRQLKHGGRRLTGDTHQSCPGRAAYIDTMRDWGSGEWSAEVVEVCVDYQAHGHTDPDDEWRTAGKKKSADMTDDEREQAREHRRLVIAHNKAWASATDVRRTWLRDWLTRKTAPKGSAGFVASMIVRDPDLLIRSYGSHDVAAELLGHDRDTYGRSDALGNLIDEADDKRAQVLALAVIFGACEAAVVKDTWRGDGTNSWHGRYLRFLADQGYTLAEVEDYAASDQTV